MKAATEWTADDTGVTKISIHAAREGGDTPPQTGRKAKPISIHAAREGGDTIAYEDSANTLISIHAAREGGDLRPPIVRSVGGYFNPRRP